LGLPPAPDPPLVLPARCSDAAGLSSLNSGRVIARPITKRACKSSRSRARADTLGSTST
jgi:hypothetical protein